MDAQELLDTRTSNGKLGGPAPDDATLDAILSAALRAPDHAMLRPWKLLVLRGEDALGALGDAYTRAMRTRQPDATDEQIERVRRKPLRAPLMIVVAACPVEHPKAPEIEQVLSAGAVAHGILLGLHARGFAGMWRTGPMAYDPIVKEALGLRATDHIVAFLYAGTAAAEPPAIQRPEPKSFVTSWP